MLRRLVTDRRAIPVVLILQVIPLLAMPLSSYSLKSQEWWLPLFLTILVAIAVFQTLARRTTVLWNWRLMGFAQGLNIISRLMMLMPHATIAVDGVQRLNTPYVVITAIAFFLSAFAIWYFELPEVRAGILPREATKRPA